MSVEKVQSLCVPVDIKFKNQDKIKAAGPLIKHSVFDALFGVVCSLLLILGGHTRSPGLVLAWLVATLLASIKYVWVFVTHDWSSLEDWVSISYLLFYSLVLLIVVSFLTEITSWRRNSAPAFSQPYNGTPGTRVRA